MSNFFAQESNRAWLYRVALALSGLLVAAGLLSEQIAADVTILIAAVLGIGAEALATKNTSIKG